MYGDRTPVPLNSASNKSTRLETRVTESIACGPAFAHNKADCGATGRRDESCRVNTGGTGVLKGRRSLAHCLSDCRRLLCNRAGSAAARLNQSDIVFIFSIRLEPTKTLQGSGECLMRGTSVSCLAPRIFVLFAFRRAAANTGPDLSGRQQ